MSVIKANGAGDQSTGFYNGVATQSLRSNQPSSTLLSKTLGTPTTRRRWTISFWLKRTQFGLGVNATNSYNPIMGCDNKLIARFDINDKFQLYDYDGNFDVNLVSTMRFRDPSAWYNIVIVTDIDGQSGNNRMKLYVNGVRQDWSGDDPGDYDPRWNGALSHQLLSDGQTTARFNGYVSDVTFLDGQAIGETNGYLDEFGEVVNGVWIPKSTSSLTFGNNGFKLEFKKDGTGTGGTDTIGADTANTNHFDSSGMDTEDCNMPDSPENNFCTYNPLDAKGNANTFSEGNLKVVVSAQNTNEETRATFGVSSGKWYWEHRLASSTTTVGYFKIGIKSDDESNYWNVRGSDGELVNNGSTTTSSVRFNTAGNVVGVYLDMDNGKWYVSVDGTLQNSADLSAGSGYLHNNISGTVHPYILNASSGGTHTGQGNFGQDSTFANEETAQSNTDASGLGTFQHSVPSGHKALCAKNLLEPSISPLNGERPNEYFDVALYSGNGSSQSISDYQFSPDWVWIKERSSTSSYMIYDVLRGTDVFMQSNSTVKDTSSTVNLTSFDSNGFSVGSGGATNQSSQTYVAWAWLAGTTFSGTTNGGKAYSGQSNSKAGFSIVTYVGNEQSGHEIPHNLSAAPDMVVAKSRGHDDHWDIFHKGIATDAETDFIRWNSTNGASDASSVWNDTAPTASVVTLGNTDDVNKNNTDHIMYVFHNVEGYSRFGHYTGNGSSDGQYVYTGFRPAYVLIKESSDNGNNWNVHDYKRDPYNVGSNRLRISRDNDTEDTGTFIDLLSNGFKLRLSGTAYNGNGDTYIYMAFAEMPAKYANAR